MKPKVGSLFAGIGGFDLGFERAGFEVAWCVEICPRARAVLARHFPNARLYSDIREIDGSELAPVDVVCGGFPCQDLSVAGKRAGLAGERSGLFHDAMRIVRRVRPRAVVVENVAGLLSSNRGHDFATVLREMGEGWDCSEVAWRMLDSRYFGVAQRRRRVFVVASSAIGSAEQILALQQGSDGDFATVGNARQVAAADAARRAYGSCWWDGSDCAATLTKQNANGAQRMPDKGNFGAVLERGTIVRRLTPVECERLQGFPDGWTEFADGQRVADSHRYRQAGNAVTVNVAEWIARRMHRAMFTANG